jgi:small-conductance mechanosensitive channel
MARGVRVIHGADFGGSFEPVTIWGGLAVGLAAAGWVTARVARTLLARMAARTHFQTDDAFVAWLQPFLLPAAELVALSIFIAVAPLTPSAASLAHKAVGLGFTLLAMTALVKIGLFLLRRTIWHNPHLAPVATPMLRVGEILLISIATLVVLDTAGISLGPVLATLGVGSVAVALALQPSLSNFFAGLYLLIDRPLVPGDYVKLDSGEEGYVVQVGWRSTRIRRLQNNMVIVPNDKLAGSIITNYFQPDRPMALLIPVSVSYEADSRHVEEVLVRVAKESAENIKGLLAKPEPFVRFIPGFGESSLDFTLIVQVKEFVDQYLVQHELRHRIMETFHKEHIEIPYPQRTLHFRRDR